MWNITRALLLEDYPNIYPPSPTPLESLVLSHVRSRTLHSISLGYKSISLAELQTMCGISSRETARETVTNLGWRADDDEFVFPVLPESRPSKTRLALSEIANYISFLESV